MSRIAFTKTSGQNTPPIGRVYIYCKTDGHLYSKDDAGVEYDLTTGNLSDYIIKRNYISSSNLSAFGKFVNIYKDVNGYLRCRLSDPRYVEQIVSGYSMSAAAIDENVSIAFNQSVLNVAHLITQPLSIGLSYYLGFDGSFTVTAYTGIDAKFTQKIGMAITEYELLINIEPPIYINS